MKPKKAKKPSFKGASVPAPAPDPQETISRFGHRLRCVGGMWYPCEASRGIDRFMSGRSYWRGKVTYQLDSLMFAVSQDKRRTAVVDVGAHIGLWSRIFSQLYKDVLAVEPLPIHAECLMLNAPADNVKVRECALGAEEGLREFELDEDKGLMNRFAVPGTQKRTVMVNVTTLDGLLRREDVLRDLPVSLVKVDVEGAEIEVVKGAAETIKRCHPVFCLEQKDLGKDFRPGEKAYAACEFLKTQFGYKVAGNTRDDWVMVP